jgi:hypothetical protein
MSAKVLALQRTAVVDDWIDALLVHLYERGGVLQDTEKI